MRKMLYGLMILIMLTPALVCGPFMPAVPAHATMAGKASPSPHNMAAMPDCPEMASEKSAADHSTTLMFKDCARVDLNSPDQTALEKPDRALSKVVYAEFDTALSYEFAPLTAYRTRGPPPETAETLTYPPQYLMTQRLRI